MDAHNGHDVDEVMGFYTSHPTFHLKGVWTRNGLEQIRGLESWDAALNSHLKLKNAYISGDTVYCQVIESNDWFKSVDIDSLSHDPVAFVLNDEKIAEIIATPKTETGFRINSALTALYTWSDSTNDKVINELIIGGTFVYSAEAAGKWMELFERWKATD
jgi:hypothetical protein